MLNTLPQMDTHLIPVLSLLYLLSFLDRKSPAKSPPKTKKKLSSEFFLVIFLWLCSGSDVRIHLQGETSETPKLKVYKKI